MGRLQAAKRVMEPAHSEDDEAIIPLIVTDQTEGKTLGGSAKGSTGHALTDPWEQHGLPSWPGASGAPLPRQPWPPPRPWPPPLRPSSSPAGRSGHPEQSRADPPGPTSHGEGTEDEHQGRGL